MKQTSPVRIHTPLCEKIRQLVKRNKIKNLAENTDKYYPYNITQFMEEAAKHELEREEYNGD